MAPAEGLSEAVWTDILGHLRMHHPDMSRGWFSQLQPGDLQGGELAVLAANAAQLSYLNEHAVRPFIEAAQAATGRLVTVHFKAQGNTCAGGPGSPGWNDPARFKGDNSLLRLNEEYCFENFVVGPCNRLAHASFLAVSESPGTTYNPLFIHGSVGLGKTHLMQAVCHKVLDASPAARILYLTCETFVNHFIEAVEMGALSGFRYRYRHVDMLLIDDVQFLTGRDQTQEEFFHTFNTLYQLQKQIVLSADCGPADIPGLEERLVSRFNWGLVARIDPPWLETRVAILQKKAKMRGIDLPEDVALFLASRVQSNSRELEGALNRVHGLAALDGRPLDLALAQSALGEGGVSSSRAVRVQDIMNLIMEHFGVRLSDLQGRRRSRMIVLPRQVGMYLARQYTQHSLEEIGGFFGGRDHTTVLHANKLVKNRRQADQAFRFQLEKLEAVLR